MKIEGMYLDLHCLKIGSYFKNTSKILEENHNRNSFEKVQSF